MYLHATASSLSRLCYTQQHRVQRVRGTNLENCQCRYLLLLCACPKECSINVHHRMNTVRQIIAMETFQ